jgi:ERF superfamily
MTTTNGSEKEDQPERLFPRNVTEALSRIMEDLPGIGKDQKAAPEQGSYKYRGIEAITSEAQSLFAKYGVILVPKVLDSSVKDIVVNGKPWTDTTLRIMYWAVGPGGSESIVPMRRSLSTDGTRVEEEHDPAGWYLIGDVLPIGPFLAIGRDSSDKGGNKCLSQAYKYALLQTLMIGDKADDADQGSPERDAYDPSRPTETSAPPEWISALRRQIADLPDEHKDKLRTEWKGGYDGAPLHDPELLTRHEFPFADRLVHAHTIAAHKEAGTEEPPPPASDPLNLQPGAAEPPPEGVLQLRAELAAITLRVPRGRMGREVLQSNLRGRYGATDEIDDPDALREMIAIATAWPEEPPKAGTAPTGPEPEAEPVSESQGVSQGPAQPPDPAPVLHLPADVMDEIVNEVEHMTATERKDALRELGLPVGGTADVLGGRLTRARMQTWVADNRDVEATADEDRQGAVT